jgi:hypothetical protein
MPALTHPQPGTVELLGRLQNVERRFRYLGLNGSASFAQGCIEALEDGAPAALYVHWTKQLEDRAAGNRAERDLALLSMVLA